jgi:hypothetical protein
VASVLKRCSNGQGEEEPREHGRRDWNEAPQPRHPGATRRWKGQEGDSLSITFIVLIAQLVIISFSSQRKFI